MSHRSGRPGRLTAMLAPGIAAACAARAAYSVLRRHPPGGAAAWARTNHRGEPVTLLAGPALTVAAVAGSALTPGLTAAVRSALMAAGTGAAAFGGYDDLAGNGGRRGFRGHLGALARGEVTTGAVKLGGIGATGLAAAALLGGSPADVMINAGLAAGGANLLNLFDVRPGRALKVAVAGGALLAVSPRDRGCAQTAVAAPLGAALALLPADLGERAMLGDAGANALGALLGVAAGASLRRPVKAALLAAIAGLTAASEVVSFTAVIERTPALRWLDMLGRRPLPPAPPAPSPQPGQDGPLREAGGAGRNWAGAAGFPAPADRIAGAAGQAGAAQEAGPQA